MANVPQKTLNWLYDVLKREYRDPNRTYSDLAQTLSVFHGFSPRTDVYTFENGSPALLVHFTGTIPVNFRGATYRFPIAMWIPHTYPYDAPIIYVTPTEDMMVRPGQHVGTDGRVYHHYLAHWRDAWDRSNVVDFLSILSDIFAKEPPVISKQQQSTPQAVRDQPPPPPPLPKELQRNSTPPMSDTRPQSISRYPQGGPPPPPPPKQSAQFSHNSPSPSPIQSRSGRYDAPPPLPQAQPSARSSWSSPQQAQGPVNGQQTYQSNSQYSSQPPPDRRQSIPPAGFPPNQPPPPPQTPYYQPPPNQFPQTQHIQRTAQSVSSAHPYNQQQFPQQYRPSQPPSQPQNPIPQQPQARPHPHQQQHHHHHQQQPPPKKGPPPDLLDSPFDIPLPAATSSLPAPPIPRNPEKDALLEHISQQLTQSIYTQTQQNESALPALQSQHSALQSALSTLQNELSNLNAMHGALTSNISVLQSSLSKSDQTISAAHSRAQKGDIPKVDDMLVAPTVVGKQLYDTVCEERGIEAAIWSLQEGFVRGRIAPDIWARRTRELAREGFRKKYLARKIGQGMGLEVM